MGVAVVEVLMVRLLESTLGYVLKTMVDIREDMLVQMMLHWKDKYLEYSANRWLDQHIHEEPGRLDENLTRIAIKGVEISPLHRIPTR